MEMNLLLLLCVFNIKIASFCKCSGVRQRRSTDKLYMYKTVHLNVNDFTNPSVNANCKFMSCNWKRNGKVYTHFDDVDEGHLFLLVLCPLLPEISNIMLHVEICVHKQVN